MFMFFGDYPVLGGKVGRMIKGWLKRSPETCALLGPWISLLRLHLHFAALGARPIGVLVGVCYPCGSHGSLYSSAHVADLSDLARLPHGLLLWRPFPYP